MKGYWVCVYDKIENMDKLKEYATKAKIAIGKYSGKFLVRGGKKRLTEGKDSPRTVVVEFSDFDTALKCYDSKEYQEAHNILKGHTKRSHQIIEGA
tara:strand:+ start:498 stop:785 length:288 start_codon:yes stop_codon:yes gene_type:complete